MHCVCKRQRHGHWRRQRKFDWRSQKWECCDGYVEDDRLRNERMRGQQRECEISKNIQERRLKWCGHVMRREEQNVRRATKWKYVGGGREGGLREDGRTGWGMIWERRDCRRRKCMTELRGDGYRQTKVKTMTQKCVIAEVLSYIFIHDRPLGYNGTTFIISA